MAIHKTNKAVVNGRDRELFSVAFMRSVVWFMDQTYGLCASLQFEPLSAMDGIFAKKSEMNLIREAQLRLLRIVWLATQHNCNLWV